MDSLVDMMCSQVVALKPAFLSKKPHFNFITIHYFLIMGMALFGSVCLYIRGDMKYIDALFLATGSATQSGLNSIDINLLNTWQQVVLYTIPMLTNPIIINTFVVFLRLWWFEKRFQHVVREANRNRRTIWRTISKSRTIDHDHNHEEKGVSEKQIVTMPGVINSSDAISVEYNIGLETNSITHDLCLSMIESGSTDAGRDSKVAKNDQNDNSQRQIKFADNIHVNSDLGQADRLPVLRTKEEHIAILQRQRNPEENDVLRIPGPRDADAGVAPQTVSDPEAQGDERSPRDSMWKSTRVSEEYSNHPDSDRPRNITIAETVYPRSESPVAHRVRIRKPSRAYKEEKHSGERARRTNTLQSIKSALSRDKDDTIPYLSWQPTIGRNSAFPDLTEEQREELGGIEYRSLKTLALVLVFYFWGFSLVGVVGLLPWILHNRHYSGIVDAAGQGRTWWAVFTAGSAFTDLGFTLTPDSMISFQTGVWPLLFISFLIIIGNTAFPIMLRVIIWCGYRLAPAESGVFEEFKFLLDHPRRCFTLLFPRKPTLWLFAVLVILNGVDLIFFIILDLGNTVVTKLPTRIRLLDGFFQAASTRTAGFSVVDLSLLHPAIQVSYLIMMYISVLPIAISVRRTNVYEERSLGIYGSADQDAEEDAKDSYVGTHLRHQLSFDMWYIFMGLFIISISEGSRLQSGDPRFTMFAVLFEVVSAYGTVGLSLGYSGINASLSAKFGIIAKLVIISMQIRGRHRGLPNELDRAIILPSDRIQQKAEMDATRRSMSNRYSTASSRGNNDLARVRSQSTRGRSRENSHGILGAVFHPGPPLPRSYRNIHFDDSFDRRSSTGVNNKSERADSNVATTHRHDGTIIPNKPTHQIFGSSYSWGNAMTESKGKRTEGRRHFYDNSVDSAPKSEQKRS